ncbi:hypothetical protein [Cedratvirus kamchatka]|uniref:Uncharacterized protein n=1 Tax=Cedratvirus kamchatka TaxID=2716914 RepID=A0A6G8MYR2_9VIRU|nr:hypothetical protein [Cedratvirus kamchatka]WIL04009.1 hypothetical protein Clen_79 [Cedratvirus lena]WIL04621.1 hypothetical protein Cduv_141 [Cedratvirus duvanny]
MDINQFLEILTSNLEVDEQVILDCLPESPASKEDCEAAYQSLMNELEETESHLQSIGSVSENSLIKQASALSLEKLNQDRLGIEHIYSSTLSIADKTPKYAILCYSLLHDYLVNE